MSKTAKHIKSSLTMIIILTIMLCLITVSAAYTNSSEYAHLINLNDGIPVIEEYEYKFEPGITVKKNFFVENLSDKPISYRLFFENLIGDLKEYLQVSLIDDNSVLFEGKMVELKKSSNLFSTRRLNPHERRVLTIEISLPESTDNVAKGQSVVFDIRAIAVMAQKN